MVNVWDYITQGLFIAIGSSLGTFLTNKIMLNRIETALAKLKSELEPVLFVKLKPNSAQPLDKPVDTIPNPQETQKEIIPTKKEGSEYEFSSKVMKKNYTYYALIPREIQARFPQYIGVKRDIKLRLITSEANNDI